MVALKSFRDTKQRAVSERGGGGVGGGVGETWGRGAAGGRGGGAHAGGLENPKMDDVICVPSLNSAGP